MSTNTKRYGRLIFICLIAAGLYFIINSVTSLKIFPKKIHSAQTYIRLVKKYGFPKILKHTKLKLIQHGVTIIPGRRCRENISDKKVRQAELSNLGNKPLNKDLQRGMIDKNFSNFQSYKEKLENGLHIGNNTKQKIKDEIIKDNKKAEAKYYRADVYKSTLLAQFKMKNRLLTVTLEEKFYNCTFPFKTQFFTYNRKNDDYVLYYPYRRITTSQFVKYLNKKKNHNNISAYCWDWKAKRSKATWGKFYRLYKFTIPTSTTCMLKNGNMILYGENIHKKSKFLTTIRR